MKPHRIFLSAVSSEYKSMRLKLAALLERAGFNVEHQDIFPQTDADTVRKLGNLIKDSVLVIHIVGHEPGHVANAGAVKDLLTHVPAAEFLAAHPELQQALGDFSGITYTQWEAFFALHYGVPLFVYAPGDACESGTQRCLSTFAQKHHLERLIIPRRYPEWCEDESLLIGRIMADTFRELGLPPESVPSVVPSYLPARNSHFRGRKTELERLHQSLDQATTIGITQQVAVLAAGGMGKSSLALEFAWDCYASGASRFPGGVFWLDCRGRDAGSLTDGLAALAPALGIAAPASEDSAQTAASVRNKLATGPACLLVLDNVLDAEQWKDPAWAGLLPAGNSRRLLTTRAEDLGDRRIPMHRLDCLGMADARALLHAHRSDFALEDQEDAVRHIIQWFGGLAIGLTVVGLYLSSNPAVTWEAYWQSLRDRKLHAVRDTEDLAAPADYASRVDAVIDDLYQVQTPAEQRALYYTSVLPGDEASDRWIIELLAEDQAAGKITGTAPPGYPSFAQAVFERLLQRGILLRAIDSPLRKTVTLHQVIRERLRELLDLDPKTSREVTQHLRKFASRNYVRSRQWLQAIVESASFAEAEKLTDSMAAAGFEPNVFTFSALLSKARDCTAARAIIRQMHEAGVPPNVVTFNSLLTKAENYPQARTVFDEMLAARVPPNVVTYSTLLTKAENYPQARTVFDEMLAAQVPPDVVAYSTLLTKAENYLQAHAVFDEMLAAQVPPNIVTFNSLLTKAESYPQAHAVFDEMVAEQVHPDVFTYSTLLTKAENYLQAHAVFDKMVAAQVPPNIVTFNSLLTKAESYPQARAVFDEMLAAQMPPNVITFSTLLIKAENYPQARAVFDEMLAAQVPPNVVTFNSLMTKAENYLQARAVFNEMVVAQVPPNEVTFSTLLTKAESYTQARAVFDEMVAAQVLPNVVTFNSLLTKTETYLQARAVFNEMVAAQVQPNVVTFNSLLAKAETYLQARAVFDEMVVAHVPPNDVTFSTLLSKAESSTQARAVFDEMLAAQVQPNLTVFNTLLLKTTNRFSIHEVAREMHLAGVRPDVVSFTTLMSKAENYSEALAVFKTMQAAHVLPDKVTFKTLFSKRQGLPHAHEVLRWFLAQPHPPLMCLERLSETLKKLHRDKESEWVIQEHVRLLQEKRHTAV